MENKVETFSRVQKNTKDAQNMYLAYSQNRMAGKPSMIVS
jgi:hypothetical protein